MDTPRPIAVYVVFLTYTPKFYTTLRWYDRAVNNVIKEVSPKYQDCHFVFVINHSKVAFCTNQVEGAQFKHAITHGDSDMVNWTGYLLNLSTKALADLYNWCILHVGTPFRVTAAICNFTMPWILNTSQASMSTPCLVATALQQLNIPEFSDITPHKCTPDNIEDIMEHMCTAYCALPVRELDKIANVCTLFPIKSKIESPCVPLLPAHLFSGGANPVLPVGTIPSEYIVQIHAEVKKRVLTLCGCIRGGALYYHKHVLALICSFAFDIRYLNKT
jgi:hypothetical protein